MSSNPFINGIMLLIVLFHSSIFAELPGLREPIASINEAMCTIFEDDEYNKEKIQLPLTILVNDRGMTIFEIGKGSIFYERELGFQKAQRLMLINDIKKMLSWIEIANNNDMSSSLTKQLSEISCPETGSTVRLAIGAVPNRERGRNAVVFFGFICNNQTPEYFTMTLDQAKSTLTQMQTALESVPSKYQDFIARKTKSEALFN